MQRWCAETSRSYLGRPDRRARTRRFAGAVRTAAIEEGPGAAAGCRPQTSEQGGETRDNLWRAWKRVKANRGAPGIDGVRLEDFPAYARNHWPDVREQIKQGRYAPQPVRRVAIPKPDGGERLLGIPTILDRVIQQAIAQVLTPIFGPTFSVSSFGFRPGRYAHQAIRQVQTDVKAGYRIAVDLDLAKLFDTVDHDRLINRLGQTIRDQRLLALIGSYLRAGVLVGENLEPSEIGTPQGGPLSPLLANKHSAGPVRQGTRKAGPSLCPLCGR